MIEHTVTLLVTRYDTKCQKQTLHILLQTESVEILLVSPNIYFTKLIIFHMFTFHNEGYLTTFLMKPVRKLQIHVATFDVPGVVMDGPTVSTTINVDKRSILPTMTDILYNEQTEIYSVKNPTQFRRGNTFVVKTKFGRISLCRELMG